MDAIAVEAARADVWGLYDLAEGGEVLCSSGVTILSYAISKGTERAFCKAYSAFGKEGGFADLVVRGPRTDDFGHLMARHRLTAREYRSLDWRTRLRLREAFGAKAGGSDSASAAFRVLEG